MSISRGQMPRQMYMGGGITQIPINNMMVPRGQYGLGSIVKSITGAVKGAVNVVKDVVSSDVGKLALLAAGGYYLGGGNLLGLQRAGMSGFSFGNLPGAGFLQGAKTGIGNLLLGTPGDIGGRVAGTGLLSKIGGAAKAIGGSNLLSAGLGFLGGAAASMLTPEQIQTGMQRNPTAVKAYLAQYYKNTNPEATEDEAEQFALEQTREYAANGGRIGFDEGGTYDEFKEFMRELQQGEDEERKQRLMEMFKQYQRRKKPVEAANGGRIGFNEGKSYAFMELIDKEDEDEYYEKKAEELDMKYNPQRYAPPPKKPIDFEGRLKRLLDAKGMLEPESFQMLMKELKTEMTKRKDVAYGGPMGEPRENQGGVMELDYRDTGGFVPVGIKEKADDVPAMLSKNEFVFTADAVRNAGEGNVDKGAQRLYNVMKTLENGGTV